MALDPETPLPEALAALGVYPDHPPPVAQPSCPRVATPASPQAFLRDYVARGQPAVFAGAAANAAPSWTLDALATRFRDRRVGVKLAPEGYFEGVEPLAAWTGHDTTPAAVRALLLDPELVVVRPAHATLGFTDFVDHLQHPDRLNASLYLEYTALSELPGLAEEAWSPAPLTDSVLDLDSASIWIGDGRTVAGTHFDPYDNLMAVHTGAKTFVVAPPGAAPEGHLREGHLQFHPDSGSARGSLTESTALVMAPTDLTSAAFTGPTAACEVGAGDVLFLPAFSWHEVHSRPDANGGGNIAVNYWYAPYWSKPFPCRDCPRRPR